MEHIVHNGHLSFSNTLGISFASYTDTYAFGNSIAIGDSFTGRLFVDQRRA